MTRVQPSDCHVLVVDDNADNRETLAEVLDDEGYHVLRAANGQEALGCLQRNPRPDLILLDLNMPVMNGWAFRARQREDSEIAGIPVVVLSGERDAAAAATSLGAVDCFTKPIDLNALLAVIARHCR